MEISLKKELKAPKQKNMTITTSPGNQTAWSAQRMRTLDSCMKKYRYRYLLRGGWEPDADEERRRAYKLGLLLDEASFIGTLVHKHIRKMITAEMANISLEVGRQADAACRELSLAVEAGSTIPLERVRRNRSKFLRQERGYLFTSQDIARFHEHIRHCLKVWRGHDETQDLLAHRQYIIREFLDPEKPILTNALGVPSYLKTDAIVQHCNTIIYDWKSGNPSESDEKQAAVYDAFARAHFQLNETATVEARFVYLTDGTSRIFTFDANQRAQLLWQIREDYADLIITDAKSDPRQFRPRPNRQCERCAFQFLCEEGQKQIAKAKEVQS